MINMKQNGQATTCFLVAGNSDYVQGIKWLQIIV